MSILYRVLLCFFVAALFSACSGEDYGRLQSRLEDNKAKWETHSPNEYTFSFSVSCLCQTPRRSILVEGDSVVSAYNEEEKVLESADTLENRLTIDDLFDAVQKVIDRNPSALHVEFNEEFGYPIVISVDYSADVVDDEFAYHVRDFRTGPHVGVQYYLDIASATWELEYYSDYTFNYSLDCLCVPDLQNIDVVIEEGEVVSATDMNSLSLPTDDLLSIPTVNELFIYIQEWIDTEADQLDVTFDQNTGFPLQVQVTADSTMSDGTLNHVLTHFSPDMLISNQNKRSANQQIWLGKSDGTYDYSIEMEVNGEFRRYRVSVVNDVAVSGYYYNDNGKIDIDPNVELPYPTIEDYFQLVQNSVDTNADIVWVNYNEIAGYPESIVIDPDEEEEGDELEYQILSLYGYVYN